MNKGEIVKVIGPWLGRTPNTVAYQPWLAAEVGAPHERLGTTKEGSITSFPGALSGGRPFDRCGSRDDVRPSGCDDRTREIRCGTGDLARGRSPCVYFSRIGCGDGWTAVASSAGRPKAELRI